jgi:hypothetical protein
MFKCYTGSGLLAEWFLLIDYHHLLITRGHEMLRTDRFVTKLFLFFQPLNVSLHQCNINLATYATIIYIRGIDA